MLTFDVEEFSEAFREGGTIMLEIGGKLQKVPYSTEHYEEARHAFLRECKAPKQVAISHKVVPPDSPQGRELGITTAAYVEIYGPSDFAHQAAQAAHGAMFGRYVAAYCLEVDLMAGGKPLDVAGRLDLYKKIMPDQAANDLVAKVSQSVGLEIADGADFFGENSEAGSVSESPSLEAPK